MTKEQLRNYLSIKAERAQIQALLDEMEAALCSPATPQLTGFCRRERTRAQSRCDDGAARAVRREDCRAGRRTAAHRAGD